MAQNKTVQIDSIQLLNVSFQIEGLDPVLRAVDIELPVDQTVLVQATNPEHAVNLLEILAGRKLPQTGKVRWASDNKTEDAIQLAPFHELVACYFESNRPHPDAVIKRLFMDAGAKPEMLEQVIEHFEFEKTINKKFKSVDYENQKLAMLILSTLRTPQMLVLEDPALGLGEESFLNYLDWIQYWQRRGHLRHIYLTNNHPTAARHLDCTTLFVDDGLIYLEEPMAYKKVVHF